MSNENCTYFNGAGLMAGACQATICPCSDNICQVKCNNENMNVLKNTDFFKKIFQMNILYTYGNEDTRWYVYTKEKKAGDVFVMLYTIKIVLMQAYFFTI